MKNGIAHIAWSVQMKRSQKRRKAGDLGRTRKADEYENYPESEETIL